MRSTSSLLAFLAITLTPCLSHAGTRPAAEILITAFHNKQWQVRYDLPHPTREMVFARSPDDSRKQTWLADELFEIVETDHGEAVRRKDGAEFTTLRIRMSAAYRVLPNDYAPFSPFGDGGMLFHTGRFFACAQACPTYAKWSMTLWADPTDAIFLNGRRESYYAQWTDSDDGRMAYIGKNSGIQTDHFTAIIDSAMPEAVRTPMLSELPRIINEFALKLGKLQKKPTLFASYDAAHPSGWGRQGGVLGNQIFTHIYGSHWSEEMRAPTFGLDLEWYFAHESAHLYQRQLYPQGPGDAWIHEGSAEAFAAIAMRERGSVENAYVDGRVNSAKQKCASALGNQSLDATLSATSDLSAAYSCGLLLGLAVDAGARKHGKEGLYEVWRDYLNRAERGPRTRSAYMEAIERVGGTELKDQLQQSIVNVDPDLIR